MYKFSVGIGITVYNEEKNIEYILRSLLEQKETDFKIEKIIIVSDASTDKTNALVSGFKDPRLQPIINKSRQGQNYSQNTIFSLADTDIVILFEADTYPKDDMFLSKLLKPILENKEVGFVQGNPLPLAPKNFFEKILHAQDASFYKFAKEINNPEDLFISGGAGRAFVRNVYKNLAWSKDVPEDSFAYHWLKSKKVKMIFQQDAICLYRLPQTLKDYLIKKQKVIAGQKALEKHYSNDFSVRRNILPRLLIFKIASYFLITRPILFFGYLVIKLIEKFNIKKETFKDGWTYPYSTKTLFQ